MSVFKSPNADSRDGWREIKTKERERSERSGDKQEEWDADL